MTFRATNKRHRIAHEENIMCADIMKTNRAAFPVEIKWYSVRPHSPSRFEHTILINVESDAVPISNDRLSVIRIRVVQLALAYIYVQSDPFK